MHSASGDLQHRQILITGGTGSFGRAFIKYALEHLNPARLVVFSRDELKQYETRQLFDDDPRLRFFVGDVRDEPRLRRAMDGIEIVIHAAALKQVDTAEYNPSECIKTNVLGAQNVIDAAIDAGVHKVIALSTDKASSPVNLYGASKLCSDKLFIAGNHYAAHMNSAFSVVRYGNVAGSRGSVVNLFLRLASTGMLPITDVRMTRFWITMDQAIRTVLMGLRDMRGGELYVPKIPSIKILDLARAIAPDAELKIVGVRPGEKLHEEMISVDDARRTREYDDYYVIYPVKADWTDEEDWRSAGSPVPEGFRYSSGDNPMWLDEDDLRRMISSFHA
ncbi:MAG: UDP-N-acetylglucosamine 4,6-dehydratase (inverting) [Actinomycetota bacterium]|nr:UDP-N-acetylglucosamine 4,6-dehydratase (inverting) [Actinomycetota bacterium]